MSKQPLGVGQRHSQPASETVKTVQRKHQQQAQQLLNAYHQGDLQAIDTFRSRIPEATQPAYKPTLLHARMLVARDRMIPQKLSLEKLKKEAKDLLKQVKNAIPEAIERIEPYQHVSLQTIKLADAQFVIAREQGLPSWAKLKHHIESIDHASQHIHHAQQSPTLNTKHCISVVVTI